MSGKEVEVGQEDFARVEPCAGVDPRGIVEDFQQDLLVGAAGQPGVRSGIVLPEGSVVAGLPAFDGFGGGFVAGVGVELMCDGPAAEAGAVGFEVEPAMGFTGHGAVRGRWLGGKEFGDQGGDWGGPIRLMIPAGATGRPDVGTALRAGEQVVGAQWVAAADADAQCECDRCGREQAAAGLGEERADQWRGDAVNELVGRLTFFMARKVAGKWILRRGTGAGQGWPGHRKAARLAVDQASGGVQVAAPQSVILR